MSQILDDFVKDSFRAGRTRAEVHAALIEAGWPEEQLSDMWAQYYDKPFPVPIPLPRVYVSPRYTALNLFFFLVLLLTIWAGSSIIFTFLDYYLPDGLGRRQGLFFSSGQQIGEALRGYLAMVAVCVPLVIFISHMIARATAQGSQRVPVIRLKLIYLVFFCAAFVLLIDFILFVYYFLSGELSLRFIIKVAVCAIVTWGLYTYYRPEIGSVEKKA